MTPPNNLEAMRLAAGLTAHQAAQAVGLTRTDSIYAAEKGRKPLGAKRLRELAKVYGCDFIDAQPARLMARTPTPRGETMLRTNQVWTCCEAQRIIHACNGPVSIPLCGKTLTSRSVVATAQSNVNCDKCRQILVSGK